MRTTLIAWLLSLFLALPTRAATIPQQVRLIQTFRTIAGLPPLNRKAVQRLANASPATLEAAQREAAHALIETLDPAFAANPSPRDSDAMKTVKASVAQARKLVVRDHSVLKELRKTILKDDQIDLAALEPLYTNARLDKLPADPILRVLVLDGMPTPEDHRKIPLKRPDAKARKKAATLGAVDALRRHQNSTTTEIRNGNYLGAWNRARATLIAIRRPDILQHTRNFLTEIARSFQAKIKARSAQGVYGERPVPGDEKIRRQKHGDCAVQQLYNHPQLKEIRLLLPYGRFLAIVENFVGESVRREGLGYHETRLILEELGFAMTHVNRPKNAKELAASLEKHGALLIGIRWTRSTSPMDNGTDHAVLLREFARGRFVVVDSNQTKPQGYTFEELQLLSASEYRAVAPKPEVDLKSAAAAFTRRYKSRRPSIFAGRA